ncbi:MAG: hypothetical protein ABI743_14015, partial [bacterium]
TARTEAPSQARRVSRLVESAGSLNESGWQSLSPVSGAMDCTDPASLQRTCEQLWLTHPLVGQIVSIGCDFTIGEGATAVAREPLVQEALDRVIAAQPAWTSLQRAIATHLAVYGEVFLRVMAHDEGPRLRIIPPLEIAACWYDAEQRLTGAVWSRTVEALPSMEQMARRNGTWWSPRPSSVEQEFVPGADLVHVVAQAGLPGQRGIPELARVIPWVNRYDQWLQDRVRINKSRGAFAFLRKVPSWGQDPGNSLAGSNQNDQPVPRPGSVLVVNEQESWEVLAPQVGADDASADGRALKLMILAGAGIAEHYMGDLAQSNLATAQAAELPMLKRFEAQQRRVEAVLGQALTKALGMLGVAGSFELSLPSPGLADGLQLTKTLELQLQLGLISVQTARSLIPWITDVAEEARRIAAEHAMGTEVGP